MYPVSILGLMYPFVSVEIGNAFVTADIVTAGVVLVFLYLRVCSKAWLTDLRCLRYGIVVIF